MLRQILTIAIIALPLIASACAEQPNVARVSVLTSGKILLNGRESELPAIEAEFKRLKKANGGVWYYRENAQLEPSARAMTVIQLVVENVLPVSMSTKPDFSDYVDDQGKTHPRKL
jgi:hypothetical protein